jgi:hypothetical protein
MATSAWWIALLLPVLLSAPWIAAAVWTVIRGPSGMWDEPLAPRSPSRRHLWTS